MPTDAECISRITALGYEELLEFWGRIEAGGVPDWDPGRPFEYLILRAFQLEGAEVRWPYTVALAEENVEQIDGVIYAAGLAGLAEAKDQADPLGIEAIAKMRNQLARRPAGTLGLLFSRRGFTNPARILAQFMAPQTILLWDGVDVAHALSHRKMTEGLLRKFRYAVEHGLPDFNLLEVQWS